MSLSAALSPICATAAEKFAPRSRYDTHALVRVFEKIAHARKTEQTPVVIFDIDDTLTYPTERNFAILKDFLAQADVQKEHSTEVAKLRKLDRFSEMGYSLLDSAKDFGAGETLLKKLTDFWTARFFTSEYLHHDTEIPGASEYVSKIVDPDGDPKTDDGAIVIYFTGRNPSMLPETHATLERFGFPKPDGERVRLVIKEDKDQPDAEFKEFHLTSFGKLGPVVGGFENEPKHVNLFKTYYPDGIMIFLDTHHSHPTNPATGKPLEPLPSIPWVKDYQRASRS